MNLTELCKEAIRLSENQVAEKWDPRNLEYNVQSSLHYATLAKAALHAWETIDTILPCGCEKHESLGDLICIKHVIERELDAICAGKDGDK